MSRERNVQMAKRSDGETSSEGATSRGETSISLLPHDAPPTPTMALFVLIALPAVFLVALRRTKRLFPLEMGRHWQYINHIFD